MSSIRIPRLYHRMPAVFGPFPGPRQSFEGLRRSGVGMRSVEAFLTFTARQGDLADLLPPKFTFQKPGHTGFVTIAPKRLDNLEWLAGRGYSLLSVYIHGIQATDKYNPAKIYRGTFIPVLWENLADPIISGREELGYPKLFADLDLSSVSPACTTYSAAAAWQGSQFADFQLRGLHIQEERDSSDTQWGRGIAPPEAGVDEGLLLWRYMPATGRPGDSDAEYAVFIEHAEEAKRMQKAPPRVVRRMEAAEGQFRWDPRDWQALPTLHHIVQRLADIRTQDIHACGLVQKLGGGDLSSARRVDL